MSRRAEARTRYYTREESSRLGWDSRHPNNGGQFLEEQEVVDYFPELKPLLGQNRPDFGVVVGERLVMIIECKNEFGKVTEAVAQAQGYAEAIEAAHRVQVVVGIAGTPETSYQTRVRYRTADGWVPLVSHGYELTQIPAPPEVSLAIETNDGTTDVRLPDENEFYDAAITISRLFRGARIEESLRPKVLGAVILALYQGDFSMEPDVVIEHINSNVQAAVNACGDVPPERRQFLAEALKLSVEATALRGIIRRVVLQLERLNVRSIMRSEVDFLGGFYEAFLRYGADNNQLGIVFTPRHVTRFCADATAVGVGMSVYDPACGTGGFLVAAFDRMMAQATTATARQTAKNSLYGCDTNSTVWALAILNMIFRGDGKSHITYGSCFDNPAATAHTFDRVLLNPPFSQDDEPETAFIDHALQTLRPGGELAAVVPAGMLADEQHAQWREDLMLNHGVLGAISMPVDLFYPTGAPTCLLFVKAHVPDASRPTLFSRVANDGFTISKRRRVPVSGSQLPELLEMLETLRRNASVPDQPGFVCTVDRELLLNGGELCAEDWLPQEELSIDEYRRMVDATLRRMCLAVVAHPDLADALIEDFAEQLAEIENDEAKPVGRVPLSDVFEIVGGKSSGISNYPPGGAAYISSGDAQNSVVGLVDAPDAEVFAQPCITITAFGQANIQPWSFAARGNGGSAVRVLVPKYAMTTNELLWYAAQVNHQRWRFHYGRMAIKSRLLRLTVDTYPLEDEPPVAIPELVEQFATSLQQILP